MDSNIEHVFINPELMGGGVALFDLNNDGLVDIYFTGGAYEDKLYKNMGDGTFKEIGSESAIFDTRVIKTMAVTTGDIDNDGYKDIFVATERDESGLLFYNNGDETFTNISSTAGIVEKGWGMGAVFIDLNNDGFLDISVINYIQDYKSILDDETKEVIGFDHNCLENFLYMNNGDLTFTEAGDSLNANSKGCGLSITTTDINDDHFPDMYIANDFGEWIVPNQLFEYDTTNNQFTERAEGSGLNYEMYGMGIATGDYDRNGLMDYYISNIGKNILSYNQGDGSFSDETDFAGVGCESVNDLNSTSWGNAFLDVDNDGWEDLFVANGYIPAAKFIETSQVDPDKLFLNQKNGTFQDISNTANIAFDGISRGMAYGDLNMDGMLDIVINVAHRVKFNSENVKIYINQSKDQNNNWLGIKLNGVHVNRDGIGAKIQVYLGDDILVREYTTGGSHASQHSSIIHFGIGKAESIDSLVVIWPGGKMQKFTELQDINQIINITEDVQEYEILGCTDPEAKNYNANSDINYGCIFEDRVTRIDGGYNSMINLYPNPARDILRIQVRDQSLYQLYIINNTGQVLIESTLNPESLNVIDLSALIPGLYHIKLESKNQDVIYSKLVVK